MVYPILYNIFNGINIVLCKIVHFKFNNVQGCAIDSIEQQILHININIACHTFSISIASGQVQRPQTTGAEQFLLEMQVLKAEHWHQFGNTEAFQSSDPTLDHAPVQIILS